MPTINARALTTVLSVTAALGVAAITAPAIAGSGAKSSSTASAALAAATPETSRVSPLSRGLDREDVTLQMPAGAVNGPTVDQLDHATAADAVRAAAEKAAAEAAAKAATAKKAAAKAAAARVAQAPAALPSGGDLAAFLGDDTFDRLAGCEAGGRWDANTGNGYYGGLQFSLGTWRSNGGTGLPSDNPREVQIAVARNLVIRAGGFHAWPACSKKLGLPQ